VSLNSIDLELYRERLYLLILLTFSHVVKSLASSKPDSTFEVYRSTRKKIVKEFRIHLFYKAGMKLTSFLLSL